MHIQRSHHHVVFFGALAALTLTAPARADLITVESQAEMTFVAPELLAEIDFGVVEGELVALSYSYDTCVPDVGTFTATSFLHTQTGEQVFATEFPGFTNSEHPDPLDFYQAGGFTTINAHFSSFGLELVDEEQTLLPLGPASYLSTAALPDWETNRFLIGIASPEYPSDGWGWIYIAEGQITSLSATVTPADCDTGDDDSDGDGVPDDDDTCPTTGSGQVTNADGCSVEDLVPCAGPNGGGDWANHGEFVSSVTAVVRAMFQAGLITEEERDALIGKAAKSGCGK